jgi:hypothetical protein
MPLPEFPTAAANRLAQLNGEAWNATTNPFGMDDGGHVPNWPPVMNDMAVLSNYHAALAVILADMAEQVALDAQTAEEGSGTEATIATIRAAANVAHYVSMRNVAAANVPVALTDAPSIAFDMGTGINFTVTLGAAGRALANPTNQTPGKSGFLNVVQDSTGGRAITVWGSNFVWIGDKPFWPTVAGARTKIAYFVNAVGDVELAFAGSSA